MTQAGLAGGPERRELLALLDAAAARGAPIRFWWRDDDAQTASPQLDRLLALANRHSLPLALAVIPQPATAELAARLAEESRVAVLQHGWRHQAHNPAGEKKAELGSHRPLKQVLEELRSGRDKLAGLFADRSRPVLVPPWNRVGKDVAAARHVVGLPGLSLFGDKSTADPHLVNTHIDITIWKPRRRPMELPTVYGALGREVRKRIAGLDEPLGILSHHLVHEEASWSLLEALCDDLAHHPGAAWPNVDELFGLAPDGGV